MTAAHKLAVSPAPSSRTRVSSLAVRAAATLLSGSAHVAELRQSAADIREAAHGSHDHWAPLQRAVAARQERDAAEMAAALDELQWLVSGCPLPTSPRR